MTSLRLEDHGLAWEHAPAVLGHPFGDGQWAVLHRDRDLTAAGLDALHAGDGDAWLDLCRTWDRIGPPLVDAPHLALPTGACRRTAAARARAGRRARHRPAPRDAGRLARPRAVRRPGRRAAARRQRRSRRLPARLTRLGRLRRADDDARPDRRLPCSARRGPGADRRARRALHRPRRADRDRRAGHPRRRARRRRRRRRRPATARRTTPAWSSPTSSRRTSSAGSCDEEDLPAAAWCAGCATSSSTPAPSRSTGR